MFEIACGIQLNNENFNFRFYAKEYRKTWKMLKRWYHKGFLSYMDISVIYEIILKYTMGVLDAFLPQSSAYYLLGEVEKELARHLRVVSKLVQNG